MAEKQSAYDRDAITQGLATYYKTLARACYFSPADIQFPPPGGWSNSELDVDALRVLRRSDKVIDLLRHIPYIKPLKGGEDPVQWPVFIRSRAIRYLRDGGDFSKWSCRGEEGLCELSRLPFDQTLAGPTELPPDSIALTRGYGSGYAGSTFVSHPWCIIDCETGVLSPKVYKPSQKPWTAPKEDGRHPEAFFADVTAELTRGNCLALPPVDEYEPDIIGPSGEDLANELWKRLEWIYRSHGWYDYEKSSSLWRREECLVTLKDFRVLMREAEKKGIEWEQKFNDTDDEDYEDSEMSVDDEGEEPPPADSSDELASDSDMEDETAEDLEAELALLVAERNDPITYEPQFPPMSGYGYHRDAVVDVFKRYYELLSQMAYFSPTLLECPPVAGWPDHKFPSEKLRKLGYSEKVIDLLRNLPYLACDGNQWELFKDSGPKRYLSDAYPFQKTSDEKLKRRALFKLKLSPYKYQVLPRDMVAISASTNGTWGTWFLLDTAKGEY